VPNRTVLDLYRYDVDTPRPRHYAHWIPGGCRYLSTEDFFHRTSALAGALSSLDVGAGDRVILLSDNRPDWHIVDLAVLDNGAVDVPVYGTLTPDQIAYQVNDSGAAVAVVENAEQMAKFLAIRDQCPELRHLIQIEGPLESGIIPLEELIEDGDSLSAERDFWDRASRIDPYQLMTIIYTSGTTGEPKGVMLTHDNMVQNVLNSAHRVPVRREDQVLEFLPLCHVLERMVSYIYMWRATAKAYCSIYDVGDLLAEIRPTIFVGVPRFYEKVRETIFEKVSAAPAAQRALFRWALGIGRQAAIQRNAGKKPSGIFAARYDLADRLVLSKVRAGLGGRLRYCLSGGAELPLFVNEFFHSLGINLVEGYGLTETSPVIAVNGTEPGMLRLGSVGKPLDNLEIKLARDGELLVRGPSIMEGYWNKPEDTAEVFDGDGFFHTGDIAEIDDDGFLLIVDRKKDIIVNAGGKNIAPQPLESQLIRSPLVDTAVLLGDRRPYIVALLSPNLVELERWAAEHDVDYGNLEDLVEQPNVIRLFEELITGLNPAFARYEQIKRFRLLPVPLTVEDGHLTPTLKVKRRVIEQQFAHLIEAMYAN